MKETSALSAPDNLLLQGAAEIFSADAGFDTLGFLDTGVLSAGQYRLLAEAIWNDGYEGPSTPASLPSRAAADVCCGAWTTACA